MLEVLGAAGAGAVVLGRVDSIGAVGAIVAAVAMVT